MSILVFNKFNDLKKKKFRPPCTNYIIELDSKQAGCYAKCHQDFLSGIYRLFPTLCIKPDIRILVNFVHAA